MTIKSQIERFADNVERFEHAVSSLGEKAFLDRLGRWSPRDIVAHLVGWNRYVIRGCEQIMKRELPFYDVDPGKDYSNVNARLVRDASGKDREALLDDLHASTDELKRFLDALEPDHWDRDYGVRHKEEKLTVRHTVDDLIEDYIHHRKQIEAWAKSRAAGT